MDKTKKKRWKIVLPAVLGVVIAAGAVAAAVLPVTYRVDRSWIVKNPDYHVSVETRDGYTTLVKKDAAGNVLDGDFKVIGFTDTHLDHKREKGNVTLEYVIRNIVNEKPDLVVFVGDNITSSFNARRAKQLCRVMEELGVYWTCVLGNHEGDNRWSISREKMVKLFASYPHCLIEADEKHTADRETVWGYGNHVINLADAEGRLTRSLFFLDGGSDMTEADQEKYADEIAAGSGRADDYVKESQIKWYRENVAAIEAVNTSRGVGEVPSTVFVHIPLPEYRIAYEKLTGETEVSQTNVPAYDIPDEDGDVMLMGQRREGICCSGHNSGLFDALLDAGSTDLVVCGHDHINDFVLRYRGVVLSYNVPSGYSSYNLYTKKISNDLLQGYTRYTFRADGSFDLEQLHNADLWPDAQAGIRQLYD
ncbi:MAG: metallophosphoesterase [Clostridia bacterium]|nr:metallophosphoesterase [Clostridia bacterium]